MLAAGRGASRAVEDQVGAIDRAALVGRWSCRELNPFEGRPPQDQTVEFEADGNGRSSAVIDTAAAGSPLGGRMEVDFVYDWRVYGERVAVADPRSTRPTPTLPRAPWRGSPSSS
jgi:hypothetical protein